ncbi:hypothetical protein [Stutzerimonas nitrititolerans]|uniref:hypothetical protein n=1 Tax=Stutzerimonas nitrititolerans TaxID=2482751 RepID=UPI00289C24C0|nr:hypothetical protein [Stutzerimonas nitrititolerans]
MQHSIVRGDPDRDASSALPHDYYNLLNENPKNLRHNGRATTRSIASAFLQGKINCDDPCATASLKNYLEAEGTKRTPAFIFEKLFIGRLRRNHEVSENWYVSTARNGKPVWFKLTSSPDRLGNLDLEFAASLKAHGFQVWKAWFEKRSLRLSMFDGSPETLSIQEFFDKNPCGLSLETGRVRPMECTHEPHEATACFLGQLSRSEANDLILSRIFINCFLELTGGHPYDIDAICRLDDGPIFIAEFKRKYPSASGAFGIDGHLVTLANALPPAHPLYHFILDDPTGRHGKGRDPASALVSASEEGPGFSWFGLHLAPGFQHRFPDWMETRGSDSGQRGGRRKQVSIPRSSFIHLTGARTRIDSSVLYSYCTSTGKAQKDVLLSKREPAPG